MSSVKVICFHLQPVRTGASGGAVARDAHDGVRAVADEAALARAHGIHGFCFHHDWCRGRTAFEPPLAQVLAHREIDLPFCVCWTDRPSTGCDVPRDAGAVPPRTADDAEAFLQAVLPAMRDPRWIRVDDRPLLVVGGVERLADASATVARARRMARAAGFPDLHLCGLGTPAVFDPRPVGFDAVVELPPCGFTGAANRCDGEPVTAPPSRGILVDYRKVASQALATPVPDYRLYRGVVVARHDTPRRPDAPIALMGGSALDYQSWLRRAVEQTRRVQPPVHHLVFVHAWNDREAGCHLRPDGEPDLAYLEATRAAVRNLSPIDDALAALSRLAGGPSPVVAEVREAFEARERALWALEEVVRRKNAELETLGALAWSSHPAIGRAKTALQRYPTVARALRRLLRGPESTGSAR